MANRDKLSQYRLDGMYYAYARIQEFGLEEFGEELRWRSQRGVQLINTKHDQRKFEREVIDRMKDVVMVFAVAVLIDEFDFGSEEVSRFLDRLKLKSECLDEKYLTWDEQKRIIKDELGMEISLLDEKKGGGSN